MQQCRMEAHHNLSVIGEELRIVLLGPNSAAKRATGNIILGRAAFSVGEPRRPLQECERRRGLVAGRRIAVITTSDVFESQLCQPHIYSQEIDEYASLSQPGPHAVLLVLGGGRCSGETAVLRQLLSSYGDRATGRTLVLLIYEEEEEEEYMRIVHTGRVEDGAVSQLVGDCGGRRHAFRNRRDHAQAAELLRKIDAMLEGDGGAHLDNERIRGHRNAPEEHLGKVAEEAELPVMQECELRTRSVCGRRDKPGDDRRLKGEGRSQKIRRTKSASGKEKRTDCLRVVLVGKTGVGKSATGNTILGQEVFLSRARMSGVTKKCQKEEGTVCGRKISVVDTPGLFDTSLRNEEIQQEIMKCIMLSVPGPHIFLVVLAVGRFTPEEKETIRLIRMMFGDKADRYTMVLFTRGDELGTESIEGYIREGDPEVQKLLQDCGGRYHVLNNKEKSCSQVVGLLKKTDLLVWENKGGCYTTEMFQEAEASVRRMHFLKEKESEMQREMELLKAKYEFQIKLMRKKMREDRELLNREKTLREHLQKENHMSQRVKSTKTEEGHKPQDDIDLYTDEGRNNTEEGYKKVSSDKHGNPGASEHGLKTEENKRVSTESNAQEGKESKPFSRLKIFKGIRSQRKKEMKERKHGGGSKHGAETKQCVEETSKDRAEDKDTETKKGDVSEEKQSNTKDTELAQQVAERFQVLEGCKRKMEELMRKYEEISEKQTEELDMLKKKYHIDIDDWERKKGKKCVVQ